jgi:ubiquinone/menaquinone biosynthesis C-methylase UbiE
MKFSENNFLKKIFRTKPSPVTEKPEPIKYRKGTMEIFGMPDGGRSLDIYEKQLMFSRNELKNKSVLDLGAGPEIKLAKELKDAGITENVTSLSPDFSDKKYADRAKGIISEAKLLVGVGQELPLKDDSFDIILALHISEHLNSKRFMMIISEMGRTLKAEGKAMIGPMHNDYWDPMKPWEPFEAIIENEELMKRFKEWNVEVEKNMIPEEVMPKTRLMDRFDDKYFEPNFNVVLRKTKKEQN